MNKFKDKIVSLKLTPNIECKLLVKGNIDFLVYTERILGYIQLFTQEQLSTGNNSTYQKDH